MLTMSDVYEEIRKIMEELCDKAENGTPIERERAVHYLAAVAIVKARLAYLDDKKYEQMAKDYQSSGVTS